MVNSDTQPILLTISENISLITASHYDPKHDEIFVIGFKKIAITNLSGQLITTRKIPENSTVIGQQRTPAGWQYLCQEGSHLINHTQSASKDTQIEFESPRESPRTAAWSPCGEYVAVGSVGTTLSVWNTKTGKLVMKNSINWDNEEEFINPPTLSVKSWSETGEEIITIAEEIISSNILVWDFKTNKLLTIIE